MSHPFAFVRERVGCLGPGRGNLGNLGTGETWGTGQETWGQKPGERRDVPRFSQVTPLQRTAVDASRGRVSLAGLPCGARADAGLASRVRRQTPETRKPRKPGGKPGDRRDVPRFSHVTPLQRIAVDANRGRVSLADLPCAARADAGLASRVRRQSPNFPADVPCVWSPARH